MSHSSAFWDKIAERYSAKPVPDEAVYQEKLRVTREYLRPDMQALEIGCGTGSTALVHAPFVKHILATDISPKMIEIARAKAAAEHVKNVSFEVADTDELDIADQSLDIVLALSVLHLVRDRDEVIARVHRMLRQGGLFVTSTACLGDTMKFMKLLAPIGRFFRLMPLVTVFTQQQLMDSLTKAGFAIDYQWQPGKGKALFVVAKKAE